MYTRGFSVLRNRPVLVDFDNSIVSEGDFLERIGESAITRHTDSKTLRYHVRKFTRTRNLAAERVAADLIVRLRGARCDAANTILIIGSGEVGNGMEEIYVAADIQRVGLDIYISDTTDIIGDAHSLPFADATFGAVWIQAVLEHVLDPQLVVDEIWRVLRPGGLVFSSTPFMQQVHEGAYDFTRFTCSGHRWLYRRFEEIESGPAIGAGTSLYWAIRYFFSAITGSRKWGNAIGLAFFWLKYFDRSTKLHEDGASVTYIYAYKSEKELLTSDIIRYYTK